MTSEPVSEDYWLNLANQIEWFKKPTHIKTVSFEKPVNIQWFNDGILNVSVNCLDRHLHKSAEKVAYIFEPDELHEKSKFWTYKELHQEVNICANVLKHIGVQKGDRVTLYMPMTVQATVAMLACARIGAVHSVIFGGFAPDSIATRIQDCESDFVITADETRRGGRHFPLKANVDQALRSATRVKKVLVFKNTHASVDMVPGRDEWFDSLKTQVNEWCEPVKMSSEDPLFILYTSGSTGKPKGVVHTTGGYLTWALHTFREVFQYKQNQIYWCTADVGWITGHSYIVYGPLAAGATSVIFEGVPTYPTPARFWQVIDRHQVNIFYTAPTAIRALMREGDGPVQSCSRKSLQLLGTVGEPINPEAWRWYHEVVGENRCEIVDTWWQTETGGILISPIPGQTKLKPGSATRPLKGVSAALLTSEGAEILGEGQGLLVLKDSWPGQMRTVYKDHARFEETYFSSFKGYYFTGDGCRRDQDGDYWITGRVDDVLNVSGHRIGTAELESVFVGHSAVAEAAVVGYPHDIKGQGIYSYITLKKGVEPTESLKKELILWVRTHLGALATPDLIQWASGLPKTRSGKIMRRILRKIAENELNNLGDISTLADPQVVQDLVEHRLNRG
ncbi:MAG: acetate--CoA ligase [Bdellovibrionales bacterium]